MRVRKNRLRLATASLALVTASSSAAIHSPVARADEKNVCVASYEHAQVLRKERKMRRAREELRACSRSICPSLVRNDCVTWLEQVDASYPSFVVRAEKDGVDVASVRVTQDNELVAQRLDGNAIEIEPGEHTFRFETEGAPPITMTIVAREGEKNRALPVRFVSPHHADAAADGAATSPASRPIPLGVFVFGGLGVAGLATFGILGAVGKSSESNLAGSCSPNCSTQQIDGVRSKYLGADVALGAGVASLGVAAIWYLLRPAHTEESAPSSASGVAVVPSPGGAVVGWRGVF